MTLTLAIVGGLAGIATIIGVVWAVCTGRLQLSRAKSEGDLKRAEDAHEVFTEMAGSQQLPISPGDLVRAEQSRLPLVAAADRASTGELAKALKAVVELFEEFIILSGVHASDTDEPLRHYKDWMEQQGRVRDAFKGLFHILQR
ncbi:hypothetical protein [Kitasatospora sp. GAS204B]|uniref:hypothetical protein n=1 Tax=unclassified Kitasatospora TaxID=2633591 RepID=UPI002475F5E0|nr:hypothetical protein [Kitasatospora sp. GAS204B]MDH6120085.1 hypothetical protein [Kitasatospora sp. GAS204B]